MHFDQKRNLKPKFFPSLADTHAFVMFCVYEVIQFCPSTSESSKTLSTEGTKPEKKIEVKGKLFQQIVLKGSQL